MKERNLEIIIASAIIVSGIVIRLIPNILYYAWGNDYGIYYYLSQSFLTGKSLLYPPNSPWGNDGYQYFPVTYIIVLGVHYILNIPLNVSLSYSIPILGGLTPFLLYLISRELGFNRMISALAGFLLVVNPVQVYQTSQANYLTTGHFFLLLSILFFLKFHKNLKYTIPLMLSIILLILSHQLSTYFFLISIMGMVISVNLLSNRWKDYNLYDFLIIEFTGTAMISYLLLRIPSMVGFFSKALLGLGYGGVLGLFYASSIILFEVLQRWDSDKFKKRVDNFLVKLRLNIDPRRDIYLTAISTISIVLVLLLFMVIGYLPSYITLSAVIISLPFILFLAISVVGIKYFLTERNISEVFGWSMAIIGSLLYSIISKNTVLLPARHFEYLAGPFSIISAYVVSKWYFYYRENGSRNSYSENFVADREKLLPSPIIDSEGRLFFFVRRQIIHTTRKSYSIKKSIAVENILLIVIVSVVLLMGVFSYPITSDFIPSHTEALTFQDEAVIQYLNSTGNRSLSVATDHQIGILLKSYGFSSPFNNLSIFWNCTNWTKSIWQISGENGSYMPIGYVLISTYMIQYGVWGYNGTDNPNQPPIYLNVTTFGKFFNQPFSLLYENSSATQNISSYLFAVNWTYIDNYMNSRNMGNLSYFEKLYENKENLTDFNQPSPISLVSGQMKGYSLSLSLLSPCFLFPSHLLPCLLSPVPPLPVLRQPQNNPRLHNLQF